MRRAAGFTMLEMLVAVVIFTIVASAAYALFQGGRDLAERGEFRARLWQGGRAALRAIEADLRGAWTTSATSSFDTGLKGTTSGSDDAPADTLEFVTTANNPPLTGTTSLTDPAPHEMDLAKVVYSVDLDSATAAAGLVRDKHKLITETATTTMKGQNLETIAEDVAGVRFRYYDGSQWTDTWDSTSSQTFPRAVEITVIVKAAFRGVDETETFKTRVALPVAGAAPKKETQP